MNNAESTKVSNVLDYHAKPNGNSHNDGATLHNSADTRKFGVVLMQNSGLSNALSPLTSLNHTFEIPILGFVSLRGEPNERGENTNEPQHELLGRITHKILQTCEVEWAFLDSNFEEACRQLQSAKATLESNKSFFFIVRSDCFEKVALINNPLVDCQIDTFAESRNDDSPLTVFARKSAGLTKQSNQNNPHEVRTLKGVVGGGERFRGEGLNFAIRKNPCIQAPSPLAEKATSDFKNLIESRRSERAENAESTESHTESNAESHKDSSDSTESLKDSNDSMESSEKMDCLVPKWLRNDGEGVDCHSKPKGNSHNDGINVECHSIFFKILRNDGIIILFTILLDCHTKSKSAMTV